MDLEKYPFKAALRYWTSEERYEESNRLWPAINEERETYMRKVHEWMDHLTTYSVEDPDLLKMPPEILSMINYKSNEPGEEQNHSPRFF